MYLVLWAIALIMTNYQHYNKEEFEHEFKQSDIYKELINDYQNVEESIPQPDTWQNFPRRVHAANESTFYYITFYYLKLLLETNPKKILDVGSGGNYFKKYIPQIVGMDPDTRFSEVSDVVGSYSTEFVNNNLQRYDSAMTIGALHAVSLISLPDVINEFGTIIKSGGRGYFAVNLRRPMQYTQLHEYAKLFDLTRPQTRLDLYKVVLAIFESIKYKIIALDINFLDDARLRYDRLKGANWPSWEAYINSEFDGISKNIIDEIMSFQIGMEPFTVNGPSEVIDGNIKLVFEV